MSQRMSNVDVLVVRGRVKCTVRRYGGARTGSGRGGWSGGEVKIIQYKTRVFRETEEPESA